MTTAVIDHIFSVEQIHYATNQKFHSTMAFSNHIVYTYQHDKVQFEQYVLKLKEILESFFILFKPKFGAKLLEKAKVPWLFWGEGSDGLLILLVFVMFLFFSCILCFVLFYSWQAKYF